MFLLPIRATRLTPNWLPSQVQQHVTSTLKVGSTKKMRKKRRRREMQARMIPRPKRKSKRDYLSLSSRSIHDWQPQRKLTSSRPTPLTGESQQDQNSFPSLQRAPATARATVSSKQWWEEACSLSPFITEIYRWWIWLRWTRTWSRT